MHARQLEPVVGAERHFAGGRFVQRDAERVEIQALVERPSLRLLGREVVRRPDRHVHAGRCGIAGNRAGDAEVSQDGGAIRSDQDVVGLQVAMNHALAMREIERRGDVTRQPQDVFFG